MIRPFVSVGASCDGAQSTVAVIRGRREMKKMIRMMMVVVVLTALSMSNASAQKSLLKQFEDEFVALSETVSQSVVEISVKSIRRADTSGELDNRFRFFGLPSPNGGEEEDGEAPPPSLRPSATGTGFFVDSDGHIVTNNHVVENAEEITVELPDGTEVSGEIVGQDPGADIAVIKIDPEGVNVVPVVLGSSSGLKVGQFAIAIGSARGQTGSVSYGHISGLGRENLRLPPSLRFQQFIQTDAAINLGNSGGPLLNIDGEVIGVNVAIVYDANSIGFAIPIDRVKRVIPQLIADGGVTRGWLGVTITNVEGVAALEKVELEDFMDANGLTDSKGTYVRYVTVDGPAETAGVQEEDIIHRVNDHKIVDTTDLINFVSELEPGTDGTLDVWRNGKSVTIDIVIGKFPGIPTAKYGRDFLGMHLAKFDDFERLQLRVPPSVYEDQATDFMIVEVIDGSPAAEAGIRVGDMIVEVAHNEVTTLAEFKESLEENARPGKTLLIRVSRMEEETGKIYVKVPEDYEGH